MELNVLTIKRGMRRGLDLFLCGNSPKKFPKTNGEREIPFWRGAAITVKARCTRLVCKTTNSCPDDLCQTCQTLAVAPTNDLSFYGILKLEKRVI